MDKLGDILETHDIPPELIYNMDETSLEPGTGRSKVITSKDSSRPFTTVTAKSEHITLCLCVTAAGAFVRPIAILPLRTLSRLDEATE